MMMKQRYDCSKSLPFLVCIWIPWINKFNAALREALGLNIANGLRFGSPILGTQVPKGTEQIGNWSTGNEPGECLKNRHIPAKLNV